MMKNPAQLAADMAVSTRQVQRWTALGMPYTPTGVRGKRYDLDECRKWLLENYACQSSARLKAGIASVSASTIDALTDASRRAQLRVMPAESRQNYAPRSVDAANPLSLVTPASSNC